MIGTNLEYFIEYAGRLEKFKDRMGYHHYGCSWSRVKVQSLLSWDLSKENSFPHHFFGAPYDTLVTAVTTIRRTCSHDSINDEDVVFLLDWCSSASSKDAFKKVLGIAKGIDLVKAIRDQLLSEAFERGTDQMISLLFSELFDPNTDFPVERSVWVRIVNRGYDLISELISIGALSLNEQDGSGRSLLLRVIGKNNDITFLVIKKGADVHLKASSGKNALDYLLDHPGSAKAVLMAKFLLSQGLKVSISMEELKNKQEYPLMRYLNWYKIFRAC